MSRGRTSRRVGRGPRELARNRLVRQIRLRPRLYIATTVGIGVGIALTIAVPAHPVTRVLLAWNAGTVLYVLMAATMMVRSSTEKMRFRAQEQDDGRVTVLLLVCLASMASLAAMAGELAVTKNIHGWLKGAHLALASCTVLSSWAFIQMMFALHYAHDYYAAACTGRSVGLQFPHDTDPDYGDFFYFAAIIGTSGQTADVPFVSKPMRRIGSLHCILAYLFNTTVLALLINTAASLF